MPYTTVVAATTITASWGNANVRDQTVVPFASASARSSAISSPIEGMLSYRTDGHCFEGYTDGAAWVRVPQVQQVRKAADETVNNSATLQNDDDISFAVVANAVYLLNCQLIYSSNATPDFKFLWTFPAGLTMKYTVFGTLTSLGLFVIDQTNTGQLDGTGADAAAIMNGIVTVGGTAGTLQLQWAQITANASNTIVRAGSYASLTRYA